MSSTAALVEFARAGPRSAREDVQVTKAHVLGTSAWIAFRLDRHEAARRARCGLGAVPAWNLLDTLMDLPAGLPVPAPMLSAATLRTICRAPLGVARVDDGELVRDLVPALTPLLAVISARDWGSGLARASRFAPYCRRVLVAPRSVLDAEAIEAARGLGIGVAARDGELTNVVLEPNPVRDWRPSTAWWRFCEAVYACALQPSG
jgi:hypothetical protein